MTISTEMLQIVAEAMDASGGIVAVLEAAPGEPGGLRICEAGEAFLRFSGYGWMEMIDQPLGRLAAPECADELCAIAAAVAGGVAWRGELMCVDHTGRRLRLGAHLMPARVVDGRSPMFVLLGRDITAPHVEAERAKLLNTLLAKSFLLADAAMAIVSPEGRFVMTNQCFDALLGQAPGALAGRPTLDTVAQAARRGVQAARDRQYADGANFRIETDLLQADGGAIAARLSSAIVERADRQRFRVVTVRRRDAPPAAVRMPAETSQVAGRVRLISLDALRESLGERWASVAKRVMDTAEHLIRKRLDTADLLAREGELGFTICFARATEEEATFRATAIAREIRQHLIGRGEDEAGLTVQVVVERVPVKPGEPAARQIGRHLDRAEAAAAHFARAPPRPPRLQTIHASAGSAALGMHASASPPQRPCGTALVPESHLALDMGTLAWAAALDPQRATAPILLDVRFEVFLCRPDTEAYLEACKQIPQAVRQQLIFLLSPLPKGVTASLVQDIQRRLKPFSIGTACHLDDLAPPGIDLRLCPMLWAAVDAAPWKAETLPAERLRRLKGVLGAHGVRILATGAPGPALLRPLHDAGVDAVTCRDEADQA